jgi:hypothetical protein
MRFPDKNGPTLYPILKPPDLPDLFAVARIPRYALQPRLQSDQKERRICLARFWQARKAKEESALGL